MGDAPRADVIVIVCEKQRTLGGSSNCFQGTFAVESELQGNRFITYARDEAFKNIMEYSTIGGVKINERCEAVDAKGKVIPGLYAAGCGRIAGRNAAHSERNAR